MIKLVELKMVTVIAIDTIKERIIDDLKLCGIKGYTVAPAEGEGLQNRNFSDWEGRNVRIECLVSLPVAEKIMTMLSTKYFEKYGIIAFVSTVEVMRHERFK